MFRRQPPHRLRDQSPDLLQPSQEDLCGDGPSNSSWGGGAHLWDIGGCRPRVAAEFGATSATIFAEDWANLGAAHSAEVAPESADCGPALAFETGPELVRVGRGVQDRSESGPNWATVADKV